MVVQTLEKTIKDLGLTVRNLSRRLRESGEVTTTKMENLSRLTNALVRLTQQLKLFKNLESDQGAEPEPDQDTGVMNPNL